MGLLEGNLAKPLMIGLGALLVNRMLSHNGMQAPSAAQPSSKGDANAAGGGTQTADADGGLLGGLSGLIDKLQNAGHGETVNSWVGNGPNKPIDPGQLGSALGQNAVSQAAQQAGVGEQQLLSQLSAALPGIVDKLTTNGRLPTLQELAAAFEQQQQQPQQPQQQQK